MKMKSCFFSILGLVLGVIMSCLLPLTGYATEERDSTALASLTLSCQYGTTVLSGVNVGIYRVAEVSDTGNFILSGDFAKYPVKIDGLSDVSEWNVAAQTLAGYIAADKIGATASGKTDVQGSLSCSNLKTGLYLVVAEKAYIGSYTYTFTPFLIALPSLDENHNWIYDVSAYPKSDRTGGQSGGGGGSESSSQYVDYKVMKHWMDDGHTENRPENITVEILKNGAVYSTQVLSGENNWTYVWRAKDDGTAWQVVERNIKEPYTVTVLRNHATFTITNTYAEGIPIITEQQGVLPQTGQLWWPVTLLASFGLILFGIGWWMNGKERKKHETR